MNTKHTPGPWRITMPTKPNKSYAKIDAPNGVWLEFAKVVVRYDYGDDQFTDRPEGLANAKLIAAAPELLDALIEAEKVLWMHSIEIGKSGFNPLDAINKAKAAIKKATE